MKSRIISILAIITLSLSFGGCKKWLDVNTNPNNPTNPEINLVLPSAQATIASVMGNAFQINGSFWAQHWTQSPLASQYKQYEQYQVSTDNYDRPWQNMYANALTDLKYVYTAAKASNKKQYMAISRLMSAYAYQVLTDGFGDIPFSEALKGSVADGSITSPKYDSQKDVYTGIIAMITEAQDLIDVNDGGHPGTDDLIYGGDMQLWKEFANTLKLRCYMRLSEIDPTTAQAGVATLQDADFLTHSATVRYDGTGGSENPLNSEMIGLSRTTNIYASKTSVDYINAYGDPRAFAFYTPLGNGAIVGNKQGDYINSGNATGKSLGGYGVAANPSIANAERAAVASKAPVYFISTAESEFLQAEARLRGWLTGDAKESFDNGVRASMGDHASEIDWHIAEEYIDLTAYGNPDADLNDYIDSMLILAPEMQFGATFEEKLETIITQKWTAMNGTQGFEAWTEYRRTGYPTLITANPSVTSIAGAGKWPQRFVYPTNEINLNAKYPGTKLITEKVWWDAN